MAVTSATLLDGDRIAIIHITGEDAETGVTKVDVSGLSGAPSRVKIDRIWFGTQGLAVTLLWDANTDVLAWTIPPDDSGHIDFRPFGGLHNNAGTGVTGDIKLSTIGHAAGDTYNVVLWLAKS